MSALKRHYGLLILAGVLLALPLVLPNNYYYDIAIRMAINAIIVLGLNLLIGFAGQISLGHAGFVGVGGALIIGLLSGVAGLWGVHGLKRLLGADDSLDVFGLHGVCGILGAVLTGVFASPDLGGTGVWDYVTNQVAEGYSILAQVKVQVIGVGVTVVWTALVSAVAYKLVDLLIGLRVKEDAEREGLDVTSHGEKAYSH